MGHTANRMGTDQAKRTTTDDIAQLTAEEAERVLEQAAQEHARCLLHERLPAELQGDRTEHARALRAARAESTAQSWLAATERLQRLEHA